MSATTAHTPPANPRTVLGLALLLPMIITAASFGLVWLSYNANTTALLAGTLAAVTALTLGLTGVRRVFPAGSTSRREATGCAAVAIFVWAALIIATLTQ